MSFIQFSKNKFKKRKKIIVRIALLFLSVSFFFIGISLVLNRHITDEDSYFPKTTEQLDYDFEGEIYFNDTDGFKVYSDLIVNAIASSQKSIQIAMYSIRNTEIVALLEEKKSEGILVEVIVPKSKEQQHAITFANTSFDVLEVGDISYDNEIIDNSKNKELMHHKFIIIDVGDTNQQLIFGSSNITFLQEKYDSSFLLSTKDSSLVNIFQEEFDLLKKNHYGLLKLRTGDFKPFALNAAYTNGFVEIWFGPGYMKNSIKSKIIDEINDAEFSIKILGWRINDRDIYTALNQRAKEGISVELIIDDYYMWDKISVTNNPSNREKNFQIFSDSYMHILFTKKMNGIDDSLKQNFNPFMHHHTLIIDNTLVIAGSNNWSQGGFYRNDETIIATNVVNITEKYEAQFAYLYELLHGESIHTEIDSEGILTLDQEVPRSSNIIVYVEKSNPDWLGYICFEMSYKQYKQRVKIPENCIVDTTRIFISDESYDLIASDYPNN